MSAEKAERFRREFSALIGSDDPKWKEILRKSATHDRPDAPDFRVLELRAKVYGELTREEKYEIAEILYNVFLTGVADRVVSLDAPALEDRDFDYVPELPKPRRPGRPARRLNTLLMVYRHVRELEIGGMKLKGNQDPENTAFAVVSGQTGLPAGTVESMYYEAKDQYGSLLP